MTPTYDMCISVNASVCMSRLTPDRCNGWLKLMSRTAAVRCECNVNGPPAEAHGELELHSPSCIAGPQAWGRLYMCAIHTEAGTEQLNTIN